MIQSYVKKDLSINYSRLYACLPRSILHFTCTEPRICGRDAAQMASPFLSYVAESAEARDSQPQDKCRGSIQPRAFSNCGETYSLTSATACQPTENTFARPRKTCRDHGRSHAPPLACHSHLPPAIPEFYRRSAAPPGQSCSLRRSLLSCSELTATGAAFTTARTPNSWTNRPPRCAVLARNRAATA